MMEKLLICDILQLNMLCLPQLFICQYHIWLAADTKGILVLIPGNPSLNILVSTFIFVCVAHEISLITNDLAQVVIPKDSMALLKRLGAVGLFSLVVLLLTRGSQPTPAAWWTPVDQEVQQTHQTLLGLMSGNRLKRGGRPSILFSPLAATGGDPVRLGDNTGMCERNVSLRCLSGVWTAFLTAVEVAHWKKVKSPPHTLHSKKQNKQQGVLLLPGQSANCKREGKKTQEQTA